MSNISPKKRENVKILKELLSKYNVVGLVNVSGVPAKALHEIRQELRGDAVLKMFKKKLVDIVFNDSDKENIKSLLEQIEGIPTFLFTDMNPIKLAQFLEKKAVKGPAKAGDIAPCEIMIKAGDTGFAPGPVISELNLHLKAQTMIKDGTVHIRNDVVTHKPGDIIEAVQAGLITRLGIEPMEIKLNFYLAWENGVLIPKEVLNVNVEEILENVSYGASQAYRLAIGLEYITEETVEPLVSKAILGANAVAMDLPLFFVELTEAYFAKAISTANYVNATALGLEMAPAAVAPVEEAAEEEEEEEEEESVGLGALFG